LNIQKSGGSGQEKGALMIKFKSSKLCQIGPSWISWRSWC